MTAAATKRSVKPIPEGAHTVTPYLVVEGIPKLMDFLKPAFGAQEVFRMARPDGGIMHAEVKIGDSMIMMGQAMGEWKAKPCSLYLYVEDVDAVYQRAIQAGATSVREPSDQFYGDRTGGVIDPCGNYWGIATHVEDVSQDEVERRFAAMCDKK
ncbi:MAG TPA: VOC family protein [Bryobacteraceae bacterium]|nr:VOC family protein [Bryobacteraceae bacterium]